MEYEVRTQDGSVYCFSNLTNAEEFAEYIGGEVRHIGPEEEEDEGPTLEEISEAMRMLVKQGRVDVAWCDEHNDFIFIAVEGE